MLEESCPMWTPRSKFPLVYMESTQQKQYIFAIGGYSGTQAMTNCEVYDVAENEWTKIAPLSTVARCQASGCVI